MGLVKEMLASDKRSRIESFLRERAMATPMPNGDTLCRVLDEYLCVVTLDDHSVAPHLAMHGYWEMWNTMWLAKRILPGWRCIDVGANFGYFTLLLADLVGVKGYVEAWEPFHRLGELIKKSARMSGFSERVRVLPNAAGEARGSARLVHSRNNYGDATLSGTYQENERWQDVGVFPLSATAFPPDKVDFVKIDVEGYEPEVWKGLGDIRPRCALIEWAPARYENPAAFLHLLLEQGYKLSTVNSHGDVDAIGDTAKFLEKKEWQSLWLERD